MGRGHGGIGLNLSESTEPPAARGPGLDDLPCQRLEASTRIGVGTAFDDRPLHHLGAREVRVGHHDAVQLDLTSAYPRCVAAG